MIFTPKGYQDIRKTGPLTEDILSSDVADRRGKKLTVSRRNAKTLTVKRKRRQRTETGKKNNNLSFCPHQPYFDFTSVWYQPSYYVILRTYLLQILMNAPLENISAVKAAVTRWEVILVPARTDLGLTVTALPATVRNDQKWREKNGYYKLLQH